LWLEIEVEMWGIEDGDYRFMGCERTEMGWLCDKWVFGEVMRWIVTLRYVTYLK
jgi:hypothetical protein